MYILVDTIVSEKHTVSIFRGYAPDPSITDSYISQNLVSTFKTSRCQNPENHFHLHSRLNIKYSCCFTWLSTTFNRNNTRLGWFPKSILWDGSYSLLAFSPAAPLERAVGVQYEVYMLATRLNFRNRYRSFTCIIEKVSY
jgi:hypothetical protein